jgi:hypothetical protein
MDTNERLFAIKDCHLGIRETRLRRTIQNKVELAWIPDHDFVVSGMTVIAALRDHLPVALPNCLSYTVSPEHTLDTISKNHNIIL